MTKYRSPDLRSGEGWPSSRDFFVCNGRHGRGKRPCWPRWQPQPPGRTTPPDRTPGDPPPRPPCPPPSPTDRHALISIRHTAHFDPPSFPRPSFQQCKADMQFDQAGAENYYDVLKTTYESASILGLCAHCQVRRICVTDATRSLACSNCYTEKSLSRLAPPPASEWLVTLLSDYPRSVSSRAKDPGHLTRLLALIAKLGNIPSISASGAYMKLVSIKPPGGWSKSTVENYDKHMRCPPPSPPQCAPSTRPSGCVCVAVAI